MKLHKTFCSTLMLLVMGWTLQAQGLLPLKNGPASSVEENPRLGPLIIGQDVPSSLSVMDADGHWRTLISYKATLDVMVVVFLSRQCPPETARWNQLKYLYEDYKGWKVDFLGISSNSGETLPGLQQTMDRMGLPFPIARDENQTVARALRAEVTPEIMIIDEGEVLRYRGSIAQARQALDTVIGHIDVIKNPEPPNPGGCPLLLN